MDIRPLSPFPRRLSSESERKLWELLGFVFVHLADDDVLINARAHVHRRERMPDGFILSVMIWTDALAGRSTTLYRQSLGRG